jgi:hypothetical protein
MFMRILEGSHQLEATSGHGKRNSWKRGAFLILEEMIGHARIKRTFGANEAFQRSPTLNCPECKMILYASIK